MTVRELVDTLFTLNPDATVILNHSGAEAQAVVAVVEETIATNDNLPYDKGDNVLECGTVKENEPIVILSS